MRRVLVPGAACALLACTDGGTPPARPEPPVIESITVAPNEHNVLGAVVSIRARHADSARVEYVAPDAAGSMVSTTPVTLVRDGFAAIPVLGLAPESRYLLEAVVFGRESHVRGSAVELGTGALPGDLPRYVASGSDPTPGYVLLAAGAYAMAIDNLGQVVWYRRFGTAVGLNFMAQPTGRYVVRPPTPDPDDREPWLELDVLGNVVRPLRCAGDLHSRPHDLVLLDDGSYWILCDEARSMDLSAVGGIADARVTGSVVQHVGADGALRFQWSAFDHFDITDVELAERTGAAVNWTHANAIELDEHGDLLVSFRNLGEITKIDGRTGAVQWRLGGLRNEFTVVGSPALAFARQHGVRLAASGALVLLDNLGDPTESRSERWEVDEQSRTARLAQSYGSVPRVVTQIGGSVQPLAHGRTLVSFGTAGRVEEYDAGGRLVWKIEGNPGYVFRAQRIASLYAPGVGTSR